MERRELNGVEGRICGNEASWQLECWLWTKGTENRDRRMRVPNGRICKTRRMAKNKEKRVASSEKGRKKKSETEMETVVRETMSCR